MPGRRPGLARWERRGRGGGLGASSPRRPRGQVADGGARPRGARSAASAQQGARAAPSPFAHPPALCVPEPPPPSGRYRGEGGAVSVRRSVRGERGGVGRSVCLSVCLSFCEEKRREERRALPARRCVCRARALPSTTRPTRSGAERWVRSSGTGTSRPGAATPSPERRRGAGRSAAARPPVRACGGSAGSRAGGPGGRAGPGQARPGRAGGTAVGSRGQGGTGEGSAVTGTASGDKSDVGPGQRPAGDLTRWSAVDAASVGRRSRGERRVRGQPLSREGRETATGKRLPPPPPPTG